MNRQNAWCLFYVVVLLVLAYLLATIPDPRKAVAAPKPRPAADTCLAPEGWTAAIEPSGNDWACVMRKGKVTKAFFY